MPLAVPDTPLLQPALLRGAPKKTRPHPPRLQHSPSLPNFWLPPHSGPTPSRLIDAPRDNLHQPSTPPALMSQFSIDHSPPPFPEVTAQCHSLAQSQLRDRAPNLQSASGEHPANAQISFAPAVPPNPTPDKKMQLQTMKRRQRPSAFLTPPLTPSSSIQTTASTDNDADTSADMGTPAEDAAQVLESGTVLQSRFLLVSQVPEDAVMNAMKREFTALISPPPSPIHPSQPQNHPGFNHPPESPQPHPTHRDRDYIKGIFIRFLTSSGVVIIAFFDVRDAAKAVQAANTEGERLFRAVSKKSVRVEHTEGQQQQQEQEQTGALKCRFVSVTELEELIGKSPFVDKTNGSFFITVGPNAYTELTAGSAIHHGTANITGETSQNRTGGGGGGRKLDVANLRTVLASFGDLSSLKTLDETVYGDGTQTQVFYVEFYDVRNARVAYDLLNGQVIFGVKLRLYGQREEPPEACGGEHDSDGECEDQDQGHDADDGTPTHTTCSSPTTQNFIPFPKRPAGPGEAYHQEPSSENNKLVASRGKSSSRDDVVGRVRPRSASAGNSESPSGAAVTSSSVLPAAVPIPTDACSTAIAPEAYYTSGPSLWSPSYSGAIHGPSQIYDPHGRRCSNQHFFDAIGKPVPDITSKAERRSLSIDVVNLNAAGGGGDTVVVEGEGGDAGAAAAAAEEEEGWMGLDGADLPPGSHLHSYTHHPHPQPQYYFPSFSPASGSDVGVGRSTVPYYNAHALPSSYYPPPPPPPPQPHSSSSLSSSLHFPLPPPSPSGYIGYGEYDTQSHLNPGMRAGMNWVEHPMMIGQSHTHPSLGTPLSVGPHAVRVPMGPPQDYWYPSTPSIGGPPGLYYSSSSRSVQPPIQPPHHNHNHNRSHHHHHHHPHPHHPALQPQALLHPTQYTLQNAQASRPQESSYAPQTEQVVYLPHHQFSHVYPVPSPPSHPTYLAPHHDILHSPGIGPDGDGGGDRNQDRSNYDREVFLMHDSQATPPERNQLNLARIEDGQDTRTTVMIKNIPNKMSDKDLITYIAKVCPRKIDFLYLRMDFHNGCNVGYAFVNFIYVQDLLAFAKARLDVKWNMFSSEKVLHMSYANYQGKEALVEKFKNSCIMDEREAWRPKIFYSDPGPNQGYPEPFPPPTHYRRKERSSYNRGTLFVPGLGTSANATSASSAHYRLQGLHAQGSQQQQQQHHHQHHRRQQHHQHQQLSNDDGHSHQEEQVRECDLDHGVSLDDHNPVAIFRSPMAATQHRDAGPSSSLYGSKKAHHFHRTSR